MARKVYLYSCLLQITSSRNHIYDPLLKMLKKMLEFLTCLRKLSNHYFPDMTVRKRLRGSVGQGGYFPLNRLIHTDATLKVYFYSITISIANVQMNSNFQFYQSRPLQLGMAILCTRSRIPNITVRLLFVARTATSCNLILRLCFFEWYKLNLFKSMINRHLSTSSS